MTARIRSHAKINLGLAIGLVRPDGYHALATIYQTLAVHEFVEVTAVRLPDGDPSRIEILCEDPRVPCDRRNTCWQIVERALKRCGFTAQVAVRIEKRLPVQGGLGAGSANAAATLIGLERELDMHLPEAERLKLAAEVGSDVPLFLIGGTVLGLGRGEAVSPLPDLPETPCVLAIPEVRVPTPEAFREWDKLQGTGVREQGLGNRDQGAGNREQGTESPHKPKKGLYGAPGDGSTNGLTAEPASDRLKQSGRVWAAALAASHEEQDVNGAGVFSEKFVEDRAENPLLKLVRAGIRNDFETVVFRQYPSLRGILETLKRDPQTGTTALYAALSGSGSALFGLYRTAAEAAEATRRLKQRGIIAVETETIGRDAYWRGMVETGSKKA